MRIARFVVVPFALAFAAGCASESGEQGGRREAVAVETSGPWAGITDAICVVHPTRGNKCAGVIRFTQVEDGVRVRGEISGLKPNAKHGFHIHEFGDPTSPDGKSAGGHYNPEGREHAGPDAASHHAGDLGNLEADARGVARYDHVIRGLTIAGETDPIVGRSVVVHANEDDLKTQPTGNAGDRIGYGVIGVAKPPTK